MTGATASCKVREINTLQPCESLRLSVSTFLPSCVLKWAPVLIRLVSVTLGRIAHDVVLLSLSTNSIDFLVSRTPKEENLKVNSGSFATRSGTKQWAYGIPLYCTCTAIKFDTHKHRRLELLENCF